MTEWAATPTARRRARRDSTSTTQPGSPVPGGQGLRALLWGVAAPGGLRHSVTRDCLGAESTGTPGADGGPKSGATVSVENATIFGTGNSGGDLWAWTGGPRLTPSVDGREVTLSAEKKPAGADPVFAVLVRYTTTLDGQSTQRVFAGPVQSDPA